MSSITPEQAQQVGPSTQDDDHDSTYATDPNPDETNSVHSNYGEQFSDVFYPYPSDKHEQECLDLQHLVCYEMLQNRLFEAPISSTPRRILDIGTGTGIWAVQIADQYPGAVVEGTDISPIQPTMVPPNCSFFLEDANQTWQFREKHDFIHCRSLKGCVKVEKLFSQAIVSLRPGGWFEIVDMTLPLLCDDNSLEGTSLHLWEKNMLRASRSCNTPLDEPYRYSEMMKEAGFANVQKVFHDISLHPSRELLKKLGAAQKNVLSESLSGFSKWMYRDILGWAEQEIEVLIAKVRNDLDNRGINVSCRWIHVFGQRPST